MPSLAKATAHTVGQVALLLFQTDESLRFSSRVPANIIPGSYAEDVKIVDAEGRTVSYVRTTYAPDGSVVSVKQKFP